MSAVKGLSTVLVVICLLVLIGVAFFRYIKISGAKENGTRAKRNTKQAILLVCTLFGVMILFFTPFFNFCNFEFFDEFSFSGTDILFVDRAVLKILPDEGNLIAFIICLMIYVATYFIDTILVIGNRLSAYFTEQDDDVYNRGNIRTLFGVTLSSLMYGFVALVFVGILNDSVGDDNYFRVGAAFVPFVLQLLPVSGYFIAKKLIPEKFSFATLVPNSTSMSTPSSGATSAEGKKKVLPEQERIETLKSYKELLDCGVLTQEEFDAKKAELLRLTTEASKEKAK